MLTTTMARANSVAPSGRKILPLFSFKAANLRFLPVKKTQTNADCYCFTLGNLARSVCGRNSAATYASIYRLSDERSI